MDTHYVDSSYNALLLYGDKRMRIYLVVRDWNKNVNRLQTSEKFHIKESTVFQ
jgi:hypothetical protein